MLFISRKCGGFSIIAFLWFSTLLEAKHPHQAAMDIIEAKEREIEAAIQAADVLGDHLDWDKDASLYNAKVRSWYEMALGLERLIVFGEGAGGLDEASIATPGEAQIMLHALSFAKAIKEIFRFIRFKPLGKELLQPVRDFSKYDGSPAVKGHFKIIDALGTLRLQDFSDEKIPASKFPEGNTPFNSLCLKKEQKCFYYNEQKKQYELHPLDYATLVALEPLRTQVLYDVETIQNAMCN